MQAMEGRVRLLGIIGLLAILTGIGAGVFFFGGYYNIAATEADSPPVAAALIRVRTASIDHHATARPPAGYDAPAMVQQGAVAFAARGCANCHGGPGVDWAKFSEGLNPGPPDLKEVAPKLSAREIFWVVKNGIRMTGMPSFGTIGAKDDEVWKITAFVKALPKVTPAEYAGWTAAKP
jgi:mono/diheme cytochrome c family protein